MARIEIAAKGLFATSFAATEVLEDGNSVGNAKTIRPQAGLLPLFRSRLYHQVRPYRGTGLPISLAFNPGIATRDA